MKSRIRINVFIGIAAIIFVAIFVLSNVFVASVGMATVPGSYAEKYAKKHHLKSVSISDNQKEFFNQKYELFDYDYENGGIMIENYLGKSEELVIPMEIEGKLVIGIGENFFEKLNSSVKNVYLPESIIFVDAEPYDGVTVYCTDDSIFKILHGDKEWKIETRYESEFVNFLLGDLQFDYNVKGDEIEITNYTGNYTDLVVIPSYISGIPVKTISMDMLGSADAFVVPETVISITGMTSKVVYGFQFAIQLIFTCLAFFLSLIMVNVVYGRINKNDTEYLISGPQIVGTVLYVLAQVVFCIVTIYFIRIPDLISVVVSSAILLIYIAISFLGGAGREHSKKVSEKIEEKTSFMKELKESTKYLAEGIEDENAKKKVQELVEEIRFSKLNGGSKEKDFEIEQRIIEIKNLIDQRSYMEVSDKANELIWIIKQR